MPGARADIDIVEKREKEEEETPRPPYRRLISPRPVDVNNSA